MNNAKFALAASAGALAVIVLAGCATPDPAPATVTGTGVLIDVPQGPTLQLGNAPIIPTPSLSQPDDPNTAVSASATPTQTPTIGPATVNPSQPVAQPSLPAPASSSAQPTAPASQPTDLPGTRQELTAGGLPPALPAVLTSLNALGDKLTASTEGNFEVVQAGYLASWAPAVSSGLKLKALLAPEDIAAGVDPYTPQIAFFVDVTQGSKTWCLIDVRALPESSLTALERQKTDPSRFPYYALYRGTCAQQV